MRLKDGHDLLKALCGNVGTTDSERLSWLINFANRPIFESRLTDADLKQIQDEIGAFVMGGSSGLDSFGFSGEALTNEQDVAKFRNDAAYGLGFVARFSELRKGHDGWEFARDLDLSKLELYVRKGAIGIRGPIRQMFLLTVARLIASEEGKRICACAATDCPNVFIKRKQAKFCSRKCAQRVRAANKRSKRKNFQTGGTARAQPKDTQRQITKERS